MRRGGFRILLIVIGENPLPYLSPRHGEGVWNEALMFRQALVGKWWSG
jgi:hypothetical protein